MTNPTPHEIDLAARRLLEGENAQDTAHRSAWEARGAGVPLDAHRTPVGREEDTLVYLEAQLGLARRMGMFLVVALLVAVGLALGGWAR